MRLTSSKYDGYFQIKKPYGWNTRKLHFTLREDADWKKSYLDGNGLHKSSEQAKRPFGFVGFVGPQPMSAAGDAEPAQQVQHKG